MPFHFEIQDEGETEPLLECQKLFYGSKYSQSQEHRLRRGRKIAVVLFGLFVTTLLLVLVTEYVSGSWQSDSGDEDITNISNSTSSSYTDSVHPTPKEIKEILEEGEQLVAKRKKLEKLLYDKGIVLKKGSPSFYHQMFLKGRVTEVQLAAECEIILEHLRRKLGKSGYNVALPEKCRSQRPQQCTPNIYRTFDGSCNNIIHPTWGMAMTPYSRILSPEYGNGVSSPRLSKNGSQLPSARYLSNKLYRHSSKPDCNCTLMAMLFGLFIDHDITKTAAPLGHKGSGITCCDTRVLHNSSLRHPECLPIEVPPNDPFYGPLNITCLEFVRSSPGTENYAGQREQINQVTSFLDGSPIYGSSEQEAKRLRSFINGQLKTSKVNESEMLPVNIDMSSLCGSPKQGLYCFEAGDSRVNEQVELTVVHMMWMREHNRVASEFHKLQPNWNDEILFQETRRIVIAELQNVVYNEYLPVILGPNSMREQKLGIKVSGSDENYEETLDPSIFNAFATAAYRFGHSLIQGLVKIINPDNRIVQVPLHETFFNPHLLYNQGLDPLLRGLVEQKSHAVDSYITSEVRNRLFQPEGGKYGLDLSAIGIQRGRDHGLPAYKQWLRFCGHPDVKEWEDLTQLMHDKNVQNLKAVYNNVDDVDLIPGALAERPLPGALVGFTHACLLGKQFHALKYGDRFFYQTKHQHASFTNIQVQELQKSNLARLLCDNSDGIEMIQKLPLQPISKKNPEVNCSELQKVDLKLF